MGRDAYGKFTRSPNACKIYGNDAHVAIWHKGLAVTSLFDKEDVGKLSELPALSLRAGYVCYKTRTGIGQITRVIMECPDGMVVDHINGNLLDNRKANLRIVTQLENCQNRTRANKNSKTGRRGVSQTGNFAACVSVDGKHVHLGYFETIEDASAAIEKAGGKKPRKANKQSVTGVRGVYPTKAKAMVRYKGKRHYLGAFDTPEEAERAVKEKLKELEGN